MNRIKEQLFVQISVRIFPWFFLFIGVGIDSLCKKLRNILVNCWLYLLESAVDISTSITKSHFQAAWVSTSHNQRNAKLELIKYGILTSLTRNKTHLKVKRKVSWNFRYNFSFNALYSLIWKENNEGNCKVLLCLHDNASSKKGKTQKKRE